MGGVFRRRLFSLVLQLIDHMQTYTHLAIGSALGVALFPHDVPLQVLCVTGSIVPDLVMIPSYVMDRFAGRNPLEKRPKWMRIPLEVSHSVFMWIGLLIIGTTWPAVFSVGLGGFVHVLIDIATHADSRIGKNDPWYAWPFFNLQTAGFWDYRWSTQTKLWPPKPFEALVLFVAITTTLILWLQ